MFKIIFSPLEEIKAEKSKKKKGEMWLKLTVGSLLIGVFGLIISLIRGTSTQELLLFSIGIAVTVFVGNLFNAWLYKIVLRTLSGKATYYDTLTALANSLLIISAGFVIGTLLWLIPSVGFALAMLFMMLMLALGYAVAIKTLSVLTGADILTVVVSMGIIFIASLVAVYMLLTLATLTLGLGSIGALPTPPI